MYVITYSLKQNQNNSGAYYNDAALFTDRVLDQASGLFSDTVEGYISWQNANRIVPVSSREETLLELLILGVLWRIYSGDSQELDALPENLLKTLAEVRKSNAQLKPGIDFLRGILSTLFLSPDLYDHLVIAHPEMQQLEKLLDWLEAAGEFGQEAKRLRRWQRYLLQLGEKTAENVLATAITLALWFEGSSEEALGEYTVNVDRYLNEIRPKRYWHEDVVFCGRRRVEYHLNMVGAEIMNRVFRADFKRAKRKLLLLPGCMRLMGEEGCKAVNNDGWLKCARCTAACQVGKLSELGRKMGFETFIVSHESSISAGRNKKLDLAAGVGVIGVSCLLNLISGGWMLKEMGIHAQCVLLDYCGCRNHWHSEGIPTEINIQQLKKVLE